MDIPAAAGPWIALGVLLGIVLLGLAGLVAAQLLRRRTTAPPPDFPRDDDPADADTDDLAAFLEHPPGSPGERPRPDAGWVALSAPPPPTAAPAAPEAPARPGTRRNLVAVALAVVLLAAAAAAVAAALGTGDPAPGRTSPGAPRPGPTDAAVAAEEIEARLSFGGVVLERHAVGVTATYPELRLRGDRAQLELPTYNCLAGEAPPDPVAAGCRPTVPEYAELTAPELRVTETADGLEVTGRFATEIRPNGSDPAPTGRAYDLAVIVVPGDLPEDGWLPAEGTLRLGADVATTTGTDPAAAVNVLRYGDR